MLIVVIVETLFFWNEHFLFGKSNPTQNNWSSPTYNSRLGLISNQNFSSWAILFAASSFASFFARSVNTTLTMLLNIMSRVKATPFMTSPAECSSELITTLEPTKKAASSTCIFSMSDKSSLSTTAEMGIESNIAMSSLTSASIALVMPTDFDITFVFVLMNRPVSSSWVNTSYSSLNVRNTVLAFNFDFSDFSTTRTDITVSVWLLEFSTTVWFSVFFAFFSIVFRIRVRH